jgi:osmotically-inducible protein OsmY
MFNFFGKTDAQVEQDVIDEINWDPSVSSTAIEVSAKNGIVTLRGYVPQYFEKWRSEAAALRVSGVLAVADELEVNIIDEGERTDEQIAGAALNAIRWSSSTPKDIKVVVEKGWVTLSGETEWEYQRTSAKNSVSHLLGVCGITNNITLKQKAQPSDVQTRIEKALVRSAEREGRKITVSVKGDRVVLDGSVHSMHEKDDARLAAWMAPGVRFVDNNLILEN